MEVQFPPQQAEETNQLQPGLIYLRNPHLVSNKVALFNLLRFCTYETTGIDLMHNRS